MLKITPEKASEIAKELFGITAVANSLPAEYDQNFKLQTENGEIFLLKIGHPDSDVDFINFQNEILKHLATKQIETQLPKLLQYSKYESHFHVRLLSWVEGRLWAAVNPKTETLRFSLGEHCGKLTKALNDFDHPKAHRTFDWDLANAHWTIDHLDRFSEERQKVLSYFQMRYTEIEKEFSSLPKSVVHNDVNDYNIIVSKDLKNSKVTGIIDFGDAVYTQTINDLAIVVTYAIMNLPDPLAAAMEVVKGYNKHYHLSEKELQCLYVLIGIRLVTSVTQSSLRAAKDPHNDYHQISDKPAWELLKKWIAVNENFAFYCFRKACGFSAHPLETEFNSWAKDNSISLKKMFPTRSIKNVSLIDMSVGSTLLGNPSEYHDPEVSEFKLKQFQKSHPETILANGYLETRPFYSTDAFKSEGNNGPQYRTVHLGTDFWVPAQTPVHAPFDGTVKIIHHNDYHKDYGPMLILEHEFNDLKFFTLYGHLTQTSLKLLKIGQSVQQGELIAYIGEAHENGNWAPHLHFQLIMDLLGNDANFNGVALPSEKEIWRSICPDPNFIFSEELNPETKKPSEEELVAFRKEHLGRGLSLSYDKPLHIVRGEGVYLIDTDGRKYLDTVNNVNHVGHQHPKVVETGQRQMAVLNTNSRYLHEEIIAYAEALLKKLPSELSVLHFVNSGSEANELALRMAKTFTSQNDMLAIEIGYHGNTNAVLEVSSYKFDGHGGDGKPMNTHILPLPDPYRGKYIGEGCEFQYANHAEKIIAQLASEGKRIAGFIGESIISCGGQIVPPKKYFEEIYKYVHEAGGLCIADEVQTGFGRMGKSFWAFELYGVKPDIVTMGKPAGNGHPLAVVACTPAVAEKFNTGMEYFNTFGGNPVSCAIGRTVLEIIETEKLQQNALETGGFLKTELQKLQKEFPIIGDVRGEGLFLGFELNDTNKKPLPEQASYLVNRMKQLGILMSIDGPDHNVLKIKPPMVFSKKNAKELIFRLKTVFEEDFMSKQLLARTH